MAFDIIFYTTQRGDFPIRKFLRSLDKKSRAKIGAFIQLLSEEGPNLRRPFADTIRGKIRELRIRFAKKQYRVLYFFFLRDKIVLVHAFVKKTAKTPAQELEQAERNMRDFIERYEKGDIEL